MKKQILVIHGADIFRTYEDYMKYLKNLEVDFEKFRRSDWKKTLEERLGGDFEIIAPSMPNKTNARYEEWKIYFERLVPHLDPEVVFIGHSMGGAFFAKYLSENGYPKKIIATFMVGAPYNDEYMPEGDIIGDFAMPENLERFAEQGGRIYIYHSKDDPIVPFSNAEEFKKRLPDVEFVDFSDRGHFNQEEFPEIVAAIKALFDS